MKLIDDGPRRSPITRRFHVLTMSHATLYQLQQPVPQVHRPTPSCPPRLPEPAREGVDPEEIEIHGEATR